MSGLAEVELISLIAMLDAAITQQSNVRNEEWALIRIYYYIELTDWPGLPACTFHHDYQQLTNHLGDGLAAIIYSWPTFYISLYLVL